MKHDNFSKVRKFVCIVENTTEMQYERSLFNDVSPDGFRGQT